MTQGPIMPPEMPEPVPGPAALPQGPYGPQAPWTLYPPPGFGPQMGYLAPLPPAKPRVWTAFVGFVVTVVAAYVVQGFAVAIPIMAVHGPDAFAKGATPIELLRGMPWVLLLALAASSVTVGLASILGGSLSPMRMVARLRLGPSNASYFTTAVMGLGVLGLAYTLEFAHDLLHLPRGQTLPELDQLIRSLRGPTFGLAVLVIGVFPGVCEELLMRGYVQTRLRQRWGKAAAILIAGALFGIMHIDPVQGGVAMLLGFYLGYLTERTGSLRPAILCHTLNNSVAVLATLLPGVELSLRARCIILVSAVAILAMCLLWIQYSLRGKAWPTPVGAASQPALNMPPAGLYGSPSPYTPPPPLADAGSARTWS